MWLLQGVPWDIPAYQALSDFGDIPAFADIVYPVADNAGGGLIFY